MNHVRETLLNYRHTVLLVALAATCLVQPLAQGLVVGFLLFDVALTLLLLAIFFVLFQRPRQRRVAIMIAVPAFGSQWISYVLPGYQHGATILHHALVLCFLALAVYAILRDVFLEETIGFDHVIATVCGYLLAGVAWGNAYLLIDLFVPDAYSIKPEFALQFGNEHARAFLFNYFSLCTLTGTGYGDITPVWPGVASLTWMEAMFGQFYLAVVVAELIGLKMAGAAERRAQGAKVE